MTQDELLQRALEQGLTREQVITALSALIENNERYLARRRRHGYHRETNAFLERTQPALALAVELLQREARPSEQQRNNLLTSLVNRFISWLALRPLKRRTIFLLQQKRVRYARCL